MSPSRAPLAPEEIERRIAADVPEWRATEVEGRGWCLEREYRFSGFGPAFAFMTEVALRAERLDHHPDWSNSYNRVHIVLTTHDTGGVTEFDFALAALADEAAARR
jgi:4a-hydroxytetrahydrobiopterin dehydratase